MGSYEDSAFMADLLVGTEAPSAFQHDFSDYIQATEFENIERLERVVDRFRAHVLNQVSAYRRWRTQYGAAFNALEKRYLGYEGLLCRQDLRQYWILYRHAMREYHAVLVSKGMKSGGRSRQRKPLTGKKAANTTAKARKSNAA